MQRELTVVAGSCLRSVDARVKLALALSASAAVMLPLAPLAAYAAAYAGLVVAGRLTARALASLRRLALALGLLFIADWLLVGPRFAVLITLRLALLTVAFEVLLATTTLGELRVALERIGLSRRVAFAIVTACCAVPAVRAEWAGILEAQRARGIDRARDGGRSWRAAIDGVVPLVVPAIVLMTQRAWQLTEAATARGLDAPGRPLDRATALSVLDGALLLAAAVTPGLLTVWA